MEHGDDRKFSELLKEWRAPETPKSLDERVLRLRRPWWSFLLTGSIRIPVPLGLVLAAMLIAMGGALLRQRQVAEPPPSSVSLMDFRPVADLNVRVIQRHDAN